MGNRKFELKAFCGPLAMIVFALLVVPSAAYSTSLAKEVDVLSAKGLTSAPDGHVWFVGSKDFKSWNVFRTSGDGPLEKVSLGGIERTGRVTAIAKGPDSRIWVAVQRNKPSGRVTMFRISSPSSYSSFTMRRGARVRAMAAGSNGRMWLLGSWQRSIGTLGKRGDLRISTLTGSSDFDQLQAGAGGSMWFAGRTTVARRALSGKLRKTVTGNQPATDLAVDVDDNAWVPGVNSVQRIDSTGMVSQFPLTYPNSGAPRRSMATFVRPEGSVGFLAGFPALGTVDHFVVSPTLGSISNGIVEEQAPSTFGGESVSWAPNFRESGYRPGFHMATTSSDGLIWAATFAVRPYKGLYAIRP